MSTFCFLWSLLFYLFWRSIAGNNTGSGGVWAVPAGCIVALAHFFLGPLAETDGFGISRWVSGCIDIVVLPALVPIVVYFLLVSFKIITGTVDFTNFALLWLIPGATIKAISWSSLHDPILLILVPVLWSAVAVGVSLFIRFIPEYGIFVIILCALAILAIPFAAASSYWAFFSQKTLMGFLFFAAAAAPMFVSVFLSFLKAEA